MTMIKLQGPFFGLSRRTFTQAEIEQIAEDICKIVAEHFACTEGYGG
jgi:hypothetical protein